MFKRIVELVVRTADLAEAEGRALRKQVVNLGLAASVLFVTTLLAVVGVLLVMLALYWAVERAAGPPAAALSAGGACLAVVGAGAFACRRIIRRPI